ncbi:MAG: hypothetical protein CSA09_00950 [Candidatus Contendobacter odensis]|uniref:Uncharacterized protein n=1 Tax=Candidatus Contendibacter odensensis TaxID=1400860 RepID=A0A2G6PGU1_9GAMM|nr:MAG: hypothetical protein CSA09_00950 [Candidatus Contendobacter odensis]
MRTRAAPGWIGGNRRVVAKTARTGKHRLSCLTSPFTPAKCFRRAFPGPVASRYRLALVATLQHRTRPYRNPLAHNHIAMAPTQRLSQLPALTRQTTNIASITLDQNIKIIFDQLPMGLPDE